MENNYKITVRSLNGTAKSESICLGCVYEEYGEKVVKYTNYEGDFTYDTKIIIGKDIVSIVNSGNIESVMNLEKGTTNNSVIKTEFGPIPVKVKLNQIMKDINEHSVYLMVEYEATYSDYPENFKIELRAHKIA